MKSEDLRKLYQELLKSNQTLSQSLSDARKIDFQFDHHLLQHDSAPAAERISYLLALAHNLMRDAELDDHQLQSVMGQLDTLKIACERQYEKPITLSEVRKLYE